MFGQIDIATFHRILMDIIKLLAHYRFGFL